MIHHVIVTHRPASMERAESQISNELKLLLVEGGVPPEQAALVDVVLVDRPNSSGVAWRRRLDAQRRPVGEPLPQVQLVSNIVPLPGPGQNYLTDEVLGELTRQAGRLVNSYRHGTEPAAREHGIVPGNELSTMVGYEKSLMIDAQESVAKATLKYLAIVPLVVLALGSLAVFALPVTISALGAAYWAGKTAAKDRRRAAMITDRHAGHELAADATAIEIAKDPQVVVAAIDAAAQTERPTSGWSRMMGFRPAPSKGQRMTAVAQAAEALALVDAPAAPSRASAAEHSRPSAPADVAVARRSAPVDTGRRVGQAPRPATFFRPAAQPRSAAVYGLRADPSRQRPSAPGTGTGTAAL